MRKKLTYGQKHWLSLIGAYLASVGVPIATCAFVFPVEIVQETHLSIGASLIITVIVSISAFRKKLKELFSSSYMQIVVWTAIFVISVITSQLSYELEIISAVAIGANVAAVPLFKISESNGDMAKTIKLKRKEKVINDMLGDKEL